MVSVSAVTRVGKSHHRKALMDSLQGEIQKFSLTKIPIVHRGCALAGLNHLDSR
jgi:hypothetical protein